MRPMFLRIHVGLSLFERDMFTTLLRRRFARYATEHYHFLLTKGV
jgi:hypothetical protein